MGEKAATRKLFGVSGQPIEATRVLEMTLEHFKTQGIDGKALIVINDVAGKFTSVNTYDGNAGKGYDSSEMTHPLPEATSDKWKIWKKKGYVEGKVADHKVLKAIPVSKAKSAPAAATA